MAEDDLQQNRMTLVDMVNRPTMAGMDATGVITEPFIDFSSTDPIACSYLSGSTLPPSEMHASAIAGLPSLDVICKQLSLPVTTGDGADTPSGSAASDSTDPRLQLPHLGKRQRCVEPLPAVDC